VRASARRKRGRRCGEGDKGLSACGNKVSQWRCSRLLDRGRLRAEVAVGRAHFVFEIGEVLSAVGPEWLSAATDLQTHPG